MSAFGVRDITVMVPAEPEAATAQELAATELEALRREHAEYERMAGGRFSAMDTAVGRDKLGRSHWADRAFLVAEQIAVRTEAA